MKKNHVTSKTIVRSAVLLLFFLVFGLSGYSQDDVKQSEYKTLFGEKAAYGGYGGIRLGYTTIGDFDALSAGVQGAWIVGHSLGFGLAGRGFISENMPSTELGVESNSIAGGYGGFLVEPIFFGKFPVHFSLPVIIGVGGVSYTTNYEFDFISSNYYNNSDNNWDAFFVFEPGLDVELNVTRFFRVAAGVSYRLTTDINVSSDYNPVMDTKDLNSLTYSLTFKFGKF